MNHTMDIFWNVFDTMGGMTWCMSMVGNIWSVTSDGLACTIARLTAVCK